jgi:hypothetical protein
LRSGRRLLMRQKKDKSTENGFSFRHKLFEEYYKHTVTAQSLKRKYEQRVMYKDWRSRLVIVRMLSYREKVVAMLSKASLAAVALLVGNAEYSSRFEVATLAPYGREPSSI